MKYFWLYVVICVLVITVSAVVVSQRKESLELQTDVKYKTDISLNDYHLSEEDIRKNEKHKMNVFYVLGEDGKPVGINMESTQTFPTYYTPGTFVYSASNYVPTYEDSIMLANVDLSRNVGMEYNMTSFGGIPTFSREETPEVVGEVYNASSLTSYRLED